MTRRRTTGEHMRRRKTVLAALAAAAVAIGTATYAPSAFADSSKGKVRLVCNGSTAACPQGTGYSTIQSAVDAAGAGDWILVWPGVYHEKGAAQAGVLITKPNIHLRGMDRNLVVVDGSNGTAAGPCPSDKALQDFTARSGIVVSKADNVSIENLTVCNYLADGYGHQGNEIWWNGGDGSGTIGLTRYHGAYLTATSQYAPPDTSSAMGQYGI